MDIRAYSTLDQTFKDAVRRIYESAFEVEERDEFSKTESLAAKDRPASFFLAGVEDGAVVGLAAGLYLANSRLGYLCYLAVDSAHRGRGYGVALFCAGVDELDRIGTSFHGAPPRLVFWEVRRPEDARDSRERDQRDSTIRFYQRLGARILPVEYLCPPLRPGLPEMRYHLMARAQSADYAFSPEDARAAALAGLIEGNGASPDCRNVALALQSLSGK